MTLTRGSSDFGFACMFLVPRARRTTRVLLGVREGMLKLCLGPGGCLRVSNPSLRKPFGCMPAECSSHALVDPHSWYPAQQPLRSGTVELEMGQNAPKAISGQGHAALSGTGKKLDHHGHAMEKHHGNVVHLDSRQSVTHIFQVFALGDLIGIDEVKDLVRNFTGCDLH